MEVYVFIILGHVLMLQNFFLFEPYSETKEAEVFVPSRFLDKSNTWDREY